MWLHPRQPRAVLSFRQTPRSLPRNPVSRGQGRRGDAQLKTWQTFETTGAKNMKYHQTPSFFVNQQQQNEGGATTHRLVLGRTTTNNQPEPSPESTFRQETPAPNTLVVVQIEKEAPNINISHKILRGLASFDHHPVFGGWLLPSLAKSRFVVTQPGRCRQTLLSIHSPRAGSCDTQRASTGTAGRGGGGGQPTKRGDRHHQSH